MTHRIILCGKDEELADRMRVQIIAQIHDNILPISTTISTTAKVT